MTIDDVVWIYTTFPSADHAEEAAGQLVSRRLAACVNLIPGIMAIYEWQGAVQKQTEFACLIKTSRMKSELAAEALKAMHPYETPAIVVFHADSADRRFAEWVSRQTGQAG